MNNNIVADSLEYYDKYREKYSPLFEKIKYVKLSSDSADYNHIYAYDHNDNLLFNSRYEYMGTFNSKSNTWLWSWSNPYFKNNTTRIARKIINYGMDINIDVNPYDADIGQVHARGLFLKSELVTSRFRISSDIQLDIHKAIASYLAKKPVIYELKIYGIDQNNETGTGAVFDVSRKDSSHNNDFIMYYLFILDFESILDQI